MKRISSILFVIVLIACIVVACSSGHDRETNTTESIGGATSSETDAVTTQGETSDVTEEGDIGIVPLSTWFDYGSALYQRDRYEIKTKDSISFSMAKNEMEGFQYVLVSDSDMTDLRCEVSSLSDGKGNTLEGTVFVAYNLYHRKTDQGHKLGYYPEPLLPQDDEWVGGTFDLTAERLKVIYVRYLTDANTVPGVYTGKLELKQGDTVIKSGDITLTVWDIYYDEETACISAFGYLHNSNSYGAVGPFSPSEAPDLFRDEVLAEAYADYLLEHRLSPSGGLPYQAQYYDERAARYLDNPRLGIMFHSGFNANAALWYEIASENGWTDKIGFSLYDEPTTIEQLNVVRSECARLQKLFPTTLICSPFGPNIQFGEKNVVESFSEFSTLHCINASYFAYYENDDVPETMLRLKEERGDTLMWYVCAGQPYDTINLQGTTPGTEKRILFWQQYLYNIDGFLYFATTHWQFLSEENDPWQDGYEDMKFKPLASNRAPTTDGVMVYWHPVTKMPVGGLGLEATRDGIEDYQLLDMADKILGREVTLTYVHRLTTALNKYTKDAELYMTVRNELAQALEQALLQSGS